MNDDNFDFQPDVFSASQIWDRAEKQGIVCGDKARCTRRAALAWDRSWKRGESRLKPAGGYFSHKRLFQKYLKYHIQLMLSCVFMYRLVCWNANFVVSLSTMLSMWVWLSSKNKNTMKIEFCLWKISLFKLCVLGLKLSIQFWITLFNMVHLSESYCLHFAVKFSYNCDQANKWEDVRANLSGCM